MGVSCGMETDPWRAARAVEVTRARARLNTRYRAPGNSSRRETSSVLSDSAHSFPRKLRRLESYRRPQSFAMATFSGELARKITAGHHTGTSPKLSVWESDRP